MEVLKRAWRLLRKWYYSVFPPQTQARPDCPHCGGIRCVRACQLISDDGKTPDRNRLERPR